MEPDLNFTEEDLQALADLGISEDKLANLREQMQRTQSMQDAPGPQGRMTGRVYTAANPLEHIGQNIQKYKAGKRQQGLEAQQGQIMQQQANTRQDMMGRLLRGGGGGAATPGIAPPQARGPAQPQMSPVPGGGREAQLAAMLRGR